VFPINLHNYKIAYLINLININKLRKNLCFKIIYTKQNLIFLNFFKKFNIIYKYTILQKNNLIYINVHLYYYKNFPVCSNFKLITKPSKKFSISYQTLRLLQKKSGTSIFILSTPYGLMTHQDALKKKQQDSLSDFFLFKTPLFKYI
jgi:ribosomal protein S8